jgi:hypothetical protein
MVFNLAEKCPEVSIGDKIFGQKLGKVGKLPIKKGLSKKSVDFQGAKSVFLPNYLPPNAPELDRWRVGKVSDTITHLCQQTEVGKSQQEQVGYSEMLSCRLTPGLLQFTTALTQPKCMLASPQALICCHKDEFALF